MNSELKREVKLAKRIEAGLLAQDILDGAPNRVGATVAELEALVEQGRLAKDEMIMANIGLVKVIAAEAARMRHGSYQELFQEGCVAIQQAVMSYDWRKGDFGVYAGYWVRSCVRRAPVQTLVLVEGVEVDKMPDAGSESVYETSVTRQGLVRALEQIPDEQRQILHLRTGWDGGKPQTRTDVASQVGMSLAKVRTLERRGLTTLRAHWEMAEAA